MWRHWKENHSNLLEAPTFMSKVIGSHKTSCERQLQEALAIGRDTSSTNMNLKTEFGRNTVVRSAATWEGREVGQPAHPPNPSIQPQSQSQESIRLEGRHPPRKKRKRLEDQEVSQRECSGESSSENPGRIFHPPGRKDHQEASNEGIVKSIKKQASVLTWLMRSDTHRNAPRDRIPAPLSDHEIHE